MDKEIYPAMKKDSYIHLIPNGGLVLVETGTDDPVWKWGLDEVDEKFVHVVSLCDGTQTVGDLIAKLSNDQSFPILEKEVLSILELAEWRGIIDVLSKPEKRSVTVKGSAEWYVPLHLYLEITDHCNFFCKHCYRDASPSGHEYLSSQIIVSLLTTLNRMGLRVVEITGGEPLTHPQVVDIINLAASRCDVVALLTNGYYLDEDFVERIDPAIKSKKPMVSVTINSSGPIFHDSFVDVSGAWERATQAVRLLVKAGVMVRFSMNIVPGNLNDLELSVMLAKELGAQAFVASPIMPFGRGASIDWKGFTCKQLSEFEREFEILARKYPKFFLTIPDGIRKKLSSQHCGAGLRSFVVGPTGEVRPCVNVSERVISFGNVNSKDS